MATRKTQIYAHSVMGDALSKASVQKAIANAMTQRPYGIFNSFAELLNSAVTPAGKPKTEFLYTYTVEAAIKTAKGIVNSKTLPRVVPVYTDRDWVHVRLCKREFNTWTKRQQRVFMNILKRASYEKNGVRLEWEWVGVNSLKGYIALKGRKTGYGTGANISMRIP